MMMMMMMICWCRSSSTTGGGTSPPVQRVGWRSPAGLSTDDYTGRVERNVRRDTSTSDTALLLVLRHGPHVETGQSTVCTTVSLRPLPCYLYSDMDRMLRQVSLQCVLQSLSVTVICIYILETSLQFLRPSSFIDGTNSRAGSVGPLVWSAEGRTGAGVN